MGCVAWGRTKEMQPIDRELSTGQIEGDRKWYLTKQGQTLTVLDPVESFIMGSRADEPDRFTASGAIDMAFQESGAGHKRSDPCRFCNVQTRESNDWSQFQRDVFSLCQLSSGIGDVV